MEQDLFQKGLSTIHAALEAALSDRGVVGAAVRQAAPDAATQATEFSVTVADRAENQTFERQEIEHSALAIDAPAAVKVRMLVGPFVR